MIEWEDLVLALCVALLWSASMVLALVGVVRHVYRCRQAHIDIAWIRATKANGMLRYAAEGTLLAERCRAITKIVLCLFAGLVLWRLADRVEDVAAMLDWRDVAAPVAFLVLLLVLTHWSNLDAERRPRPLEKSSPARTRRGAASDSHRVGP